MELTKEALAGLVITFVIAPFTVFILYQYRVIHDLLSVIDQIIAGAIASILFAGILLTTHGLMKDKKKHVQIYSPVHAMIVTVKKISPVPHKLALQLTVGRWVGASLINHKKIHQVFTDHTPDFFH